MNRVARKGMFLPFLGIGDEILRLNYAAQFSDSDLTVTSKRRYADEPCETVDVLASLLQTDFEIIFHPSDRVHQAIYEASRSCDYPCRRFDIYEVPFVCPPYGTEPVSCEKRTCVLTNLKQFSDAHGLIRLSGHFTPVSLTENGFALLASDARSLSYSENGTF